MRKTELLRRGFTTLSSGTPITRLEANSFHKHKGGERGGESMSCPQLRVYVVQSLQVATDALTAVNGCLISSSETMSTVKIMANTATVSTDPDKDNQHHRSMGGSFDDVGGGGDNKLLPQDLLLYGINSRLAAIRGGRTRVFQGIHESLSASVTITENDDLSESLVDSMSTTKNDASNRGM